MTNQSVGASCPNTNGILAFVQGDLPESERLALVAHFGACASCLALVGHAAGGSISSGSRRTTAVPLAKGTSVGRYVLLDLVGSGGMGDVYAANDPRLGRRVAVKVMNERMASPALAARFAREAQAIARLSHPNVVAIHDAGEFEDRVYLAMEFVDGQTLTDWLAVRKRTWREIRDVFVAAGRGLAAAHEAGLVHRDFKPQNVMVGHDGSVRVMDFGLAADVSERGASDSLSTGDGPAEEPTSRSLALTRTGMLLGTPLYMAPEQFLRRKTDARTDQFSFCVALHEALFAERPFPSQSLRVLTDAVVNGRLHEPAQKKRLPSFLWRIVVRGLAADPASRFPSMEALLEELRYDPLRRRRRVAAAAAAAAVLVAATATGQRFATRGQRMCGSGSDKLAGIWELDRRGPRREVVHRAFLSTGLGFAEETWTRIAVLLDDYSRRWSEGYRDACEATHVRGDQSAEVMDLRMVCLDDARRGLQAMTDVFASADRAVLINAVSAAQALAPLDRCADTHGLLAVTRLPAAPASRRRVEALQTRLSEVKALAETGQLPAARQKVGPILEGANDLAFKPLVAEALATSGWIEDKVGANVEAARQLEKSVWASLASGRDDIAADSAGVLVSMTSFFLGRLDDAERWAAIAEAILERLGPGHDRSASWVYQGLGVLREREGRYGEALAYLERALALKQKALPPNHPDIAFSLYSIAQIQKGLGRYDSMLEAATKAVEILERAYGPANPQVAAPLCNRGEAFLLLGRYPEAERDLRRAVDLSTAWVGATHPTMAYSLTPLGKTLEGERRWREARSILQHALLIREQVDPEIVAETRFALARANWELGEDRGGARVLALAARDTYRNTPGHEKDASEIDAWLADKGHSSK